MRAKVIFSDGFHTSPFIETTREALLHRINSVLDIEDKSPSACATKFVQETIEKGFPCSIHNTPTGRTFGGTLAILENEAFWPASGTQAGVFVVRIDADAVHYWGGHGFEESDPFAPTITQVMELKRP